MNLKGLLTIAAIYQGLIGLGMMFAPRQFGIGAVPANASPALIAFLQIFGGPMLGIAVLNWMARKLEPSPGLNAIILGNLVGFGCVAAMDVWGVSSGSSRPIAKVFLLIHLLLALGFALAWRARLRVRGQTPLR